MYPASPSSAYYVNNNNILEAYEAGIIIRQTNPADLIISGGDFNLRFRKLRSSLNNGQVYDREATILSVSNDAVDTLHHFDVYNLVLLTAVLCTATPTLFRGKQSSIINHFVISSYLFGDVSFIPNDDYTLRTFSSDHVAKRIHFEFHVATPPIPTQAPEPCPGGITHFILMFSNKKRKWLSRASVYNKLEDACTNTFLSFLIRAMHFVPSIRTFKIHPILQILSNVCGIISKYRWHFQKVKSQD